MASSGEFADLNQMNTPRLNNVGVQWPGSDGHCGKGYNASTVYLIPILRLLYTYENIFMDIMSPDRSI